MAALRTGPRRNDSIHAFAMTGNYAVVQRLIDKGADVNAKNEFGYVPLGLAVEIGHVNVAELLIDKGADVNGKDKHGSTPLHHANDRVSVAHFLIDKGADLNAKGRYGSSPLHRAIENSHLNVAQLLIDRGADVNALDNFGSTPLHVAAFKGHRNVAESLVEKGANVNAKNKEGITPLHEAVERGHDYMSQLLIEKGADVNAKDGRRNSVLRLVTRRKPPRWSLMQRILKAGAIIDEAIITVFGKDVKEYLRVVQLMVVVASPRTVHRLRLQQCWVHLLSADLLRHHVKETLLGAV